MWDTAFLTSTQRVTHALLCKPILANDWKAFEKVSAAISVRTALRARTSPQTLIYLVPEATSTTARKIIAALLVGNYAHMNGHGELPAEEVHALFKGDVLLVTSSISESKAELDELPIGPYKHLKDYWDVVSLSRYTGGKSDKPRVFLANPGWVTIGTAGRRFGAVVIDASHPRTLAQLPALLRSAEGCSPLRLVASPPLADEVLSKCGYPDRANIWVWDPQARTDAEAVVEKNDSAPHATADRFLWICDSDAEVSNSLAKLHRELISAMRATGSQTYPGMPECWAIYNRLRQLAVPLARLEELTATTWTGSIRSRIEKLSGVEGYGNVGWETTWPSLREAIKASYHLLLKREDTAKFWATASNIETFIRSPGKHLRLVVSSDKEGDLLIQSLSQLVDGVPQAVAEGRLEIVTGAQEARLVAEGHKSPTVLLGPRSSNRRYLDVYPSERVDQFLYPHEVSTEVAAQSRLYGAWTQEQRDGHRIRVLGPLGLRPKFGMAERGPQAIPRVTVTRADGHPITVSHDAQTSDGLDLEYFSEDHGEEHPLAHDGSWISSLGPGAGDLVEVSFVRGAVVKYYSNHSIDVFFPASGEIHRYPCGALQPGWNVVSFVDARYDSLFKRFTEVVTSRLKAHERIALDLWQKVKDGLVAQHGSRRALHDKLQSKGLESGYEAFTTWFKEGHDAVLAPQQFHDFELLARESDTYKSHTLLEATFEAVRRARGRNRAAGRKLKMFLRAVACGDGYEEALESARKLDSALGDVLAAVEILEVSTVRITTRA